MRMDIYNRNKNWNKFVQVTRGRKPIGFLVEAVKRIGSNKGRALDLGCGAGVDAKYLAENEFRVEAVDWHPACINQTRKLCRNLSVDVTQKNIVDYKIKLNTYRLIISWNTLPFLRKKEAKEVLLNIQKGLRRGGFFVFGLSGTEDDWAKNRPAMSFFAIEELKRLLSKMEFIKILEIRERKKGAVGKIKFWHQVQGIAQRKF